jgi:hypothetical protein
MAQRKEEGMEEVKCLYFETSRVPGLRWTRGVDNALLDHSCCIRYGVIWGNGAVVILRGKQKNLEKILFLCHFVNHESHLKSLRLNPCLCESHLKSPRLNPYLHGEKLVFSHVSYGTASRRRNA